MKRRRTWLVKLREKAGYTQPALAAAVGVSVSTIQRWEYGEDTPGRGKRGRENREGLAAALKVSIEELNWRFDTESEPASQPAPEMMAAAEREVPGRGGLLFDVGEPAEVALRSRTIGSASRRELLRLLGLACGALAMPGALVVDRERLDDATRNPQRIDPAVITDLAAINRHLWDGYRSVRNKCLALDGVLAHLDMLLAALGQVRSGWQQRELCKLVGDLSQLGGEIAFDAGLYTDAAQCYNTAGIALVEADAHDLRACALVRHAYLPIYDQQYDRALPLLQAADVVACSGDSTLATRHWVAMVAAEAHAGRGSEQECRVSLDLAEAVRDLLPEHSTNGTWLRFHADRLAADRGTCLVKLGRTDLAEPALMEALRAHPEPHRRRGMILADLALAASLCEEVDRACVLAEEVLDIAAGGSAALLTRKLDAVHRALYPWCGHRLVDEFAARLRSAQE